jgi:hypothetical protein
VSRSEYEWRAYAAQKAACQFEGQLANERVLLLKLLRVIEREKNATITGIGPNGCPTMTWHSS